MNGIESRVRDTLREAPPPVSPDELLARIKESSAVADRRRRHAKVALVTVAVVTGVVVLALPLSGDGGRDAEPAKEIATHTDPALPERAIQGIVDVSAPTADNVFRLTVNVGCVGCSTIWRRDLDADGGWERLHDFTGASGGSDGSGLHGTIQNIEMAPDGEVGYAWDRRLFLTEDGGRTWTRVIRGSSAPYPDELDIHLTEDRAWIQHQGGSSQRLWTAPLSAPNAWSAVEAPAEVFAAFTTSDRVFVHMPNPGYPDSRVATSEDGRNWVDATPPCSTDTSLAPARAAVFALCASYDEANPDVVFRWTGVSGWRAFGPTGLRRPWHNIALDDERFLVLGARRSVLMTPEGPLPIDLPDTPRPWSDSANGTTAWMVTQELKLMMSYDRGLHWEIVD